MTPTASEPVSEMAYLHKYVHDRLSQLWAARQLYRRICGADWSTARWECEVELRALLKAEQLDSLTAAKGYHDWQAHG